MSRVRALAVVLTLGSTALPSIATSQSAPAPPLTVERVASLPSLIGTAPTGATWSPDSTHVAFLWNDGGWPYREVWLVDAAGAGLGRVTDFQRSDPAPAPPGGDSTSALQAQAAARARAGASEVLWAPDGTLLAVHRGHLFRVPLMGGTPERLPVGDDVSDVSLSPDGTRVTFLRAGDLWLWTRGAGAAERLTSIGVAGIGRVPLGTYNKPDREVGTGVWGADWLPYAWAPDGQSIVFHASDRRHLRAVPFPSYLGGETVVSELRRGYPGDENERRTLSLLRVGARALEPIALEAPGRRGISDFQWSPTGRLLIDQVSDTGAERWLYVVAPGTATPTLVWHDRRDSRIYPAYVARWHADGRRIVMVADLGERDQLFVIDPDAQAPAPMALTPDPGTWRGNAAPPRASRTRARRRATSRARAAVPTSGTSTGWPRATERRWP